MFKKVLMFSLVAVMTAGSTFAGAPISKNEVLNATVTTVAVATPEKTFTENPTKKTRKERREIRKQIRKELRKSAGSNWTIALILSIFLGGLGIDRFYLGYIGWGIFKLLTGGGFGILYIIDLIRIIIKSLKPKGGDYDA